MAERLLKKEVKSRKLRFGLIAIILVECIVIGSFFVIVQNADLKQNSLTSKAKATAIAMPIILQYAVEHQRIITGISVTLWQNHTPNRWEVDVQFLRGASFNDQNRWIIGYQVLILADTGKIDIHNPMGII